MASFFEDFEHGNALTNPPWFLRFYEPPANNPASNLVGVGRGGSYGLAGEGHRRVAPARGRMCLTFDWSRAAEIGGNGDPIFQVLGGAPSGLENMGGNGLLEVRAQGTTLVAGINLGIDGIEVIFIQAAGAVPEAGNGFWTIRIELQCSSQYDVDVDTYSADGVVRVWTGFDRANLSLIGETTTVVIPDYALFSQANGFAFPAYDHLFFYSDADVLAVYDNIAWHDDLCSIPDPGSQPGPPTCCSNPGPGGGPFDPPPPGTPPPTTPPVIPPGGVPPSYAACTIGGDPAGASDPTDTQSLTGAVSPVVWLQLTLPDATVLRYSAQGLPFTSGNGSVTTPRVLNWGPVSQTLADDFGSFEAMRTAVTLSDTDRVLRGHLASATNRNLDGREAILFVETRANAVSGAAPRVLARGIVTNWRATTDLTIDIEISDPLGYRYSAFALDRPLPHRRIRRELFPECPDHNIGRAVPIIYGDYSDDFLWSVDPRIIPVGLVPVIHVGPAASIPGLGVGGQDHAFLICGHALAGVQSWFASNTNPDGPGPVRMETGTAGVDFQIPGIGGWPLFHDITGTDGITERFAIMTGIGPRADDHVTGTVPITLNVCGLEDNGDGTGDVISNIASIVQHFITYFALQNYRTGTWGAVPAFPGGTPKVRTTTFDTIRTTQMARVGGGYVGACYIGHQQPTRTWLADLQVGSDIRLGINHHGQIIGVSLDEQSGGGGTNFDTSQIDESMFDIDPRLDAVYNVIDFECGQQASTGRFSWPVTQLRNEVSITDHSERIAQPITIMTTLIHAYAHDIASRRLARASQPIALVRFRVDLRGLALSIGQMITLTHYAGIGSDGWTTRTVMVTKITTDPNESELLVTIDAEDVNDIANAQAFALDGAGLDVGVLT